MRTYLVLCLVIGLIGSCIGLVQDNFLLVTDSNEHGVVQIDLSAGNVWKVPLSQQSNPIALAYDPLHSKIYWTDVQDKLIKRSNLDGTNEESVNSLHNSSVPDGIAIDTVSRLVFYTDTGLDIIAVMTLDGRHHFTLLDVGLDEPRGIVLHPATGLMYWTDWGSSPKIEVAAMDGTSRRVIVRISSPSWPNGLTLDTFGKRLYWCDGKHGTIESTTLDGSDRKVLITTPGSHFFGIVFMAPKLYYTDWKSRHVSYINVPDSTPSPRLVVSRVFGRPNGLAAYNSTTYAREGLKFANGTECSPSTDKAQDNFLLVADSGRKGLYKLDLSGGNARRISLSRQTNPIAVAYDPVESKIYWTDVADKHIKRSNLDGTHEELIKSLHSRSVPDGIAVDIVSRLVYYTDTGLDIIAVMKLDGRNHFTLLDVGLDEPRGIALHPAAGQALARLYRPSIGPIPASFNIVSQDVAGEVFLGAT
ncbi:hypothetical protein NP493_903g01036 [Ridgeia piscesae]|uniref:Low-density lipoprotein receptor repeat class B n=1 Tax=Ridgeia piscesae TaxID=27915 RepID=A0AAD9KLX8_RIDPI|nr:hypothetical protein NP493_903g01036 [Ridgeia piscesae]